MPNQGKNAILQFRMTDISPLQKEFVANLRSNAKKLAKTIVLPETEDERILKAASIIEKENIGRLILIGKKDEVFSRAKNLGLTYQNVIIIDPNDYEKIDELAAKFYEKNKEKVSPIVATHLIKEDNFFLAGMLVAEGLADGLVAGVTSPTSRTIKTAIRCLGTASGVKLISSFFVMLLPEPNFGEAGVLFFADCGVIPNPTPTQLAEIAWLTEGSFRKLMGRPGRVALLSFSTKGSAEHQDVEKVRTAYEILIKEKPDLLVDGELQGDTALVAEIGRIKAPESSVAGRANILIFPDLDAGNIAYKLTERLARAIALGPILQGVAKPVNDLSRGCSVKDIVDITAITILQTQAR